MPTLPHETDAVDKFRVFISYAKEDFLVLSDLLEWFEPLRSKYHLHIFYRRYTKYDIPNAEAYPFELHSANLYLFLISHHSVSDRNIQGKEVPAALAQHAEHGDEYVRIVPILATPCLWQDYTRLIQFKNEAIPKKGPISKFPTPEEGWVQVISALDGTVNTMRQNLMERAFRLKIPILGFEGDYALPKEVAPSKMQWRRTKFSEFFWVCVVLSLIYAVYYIGCEKKDHPSNRYEPKLENEDIYDY